MPGKTVHRSWEKGNDALQKGTKCLKRGMRGEGGPVQALLKQKKGALFAAGGKDTSKD